MKKFLLLFASLVVLAASCGKDETKKAGADELGKVSINLHSEGYFKSEDVNVEDFNIVIKNSANTVVAQYEKYSQMPNIIELAVGAYTIEAGNLNNIEAAFNTPEYYGSTTFNVELGKVISLDLSCKLNNVKLTVNCTDKFFAEFGERFSITATNGKGNLEFTKGIITAGTSGYFKVSDKGISVYMVGYRTVDGTEISHTYEIPVVKAQDHHILQFDAVATGQVDVTTGADGLRIDVTVVEKEHGVLIPGEDETPVVPGPSDPSGSTDPDPGEGQGGTDQPVTDEYLPVVEGQGIAEPVVLHGENTDAEVNVTVKALNGKTIQNLFITLDSPVLTEEAVEGIIPLSFDMANPDADLSSKLDELGLVPTGSTVKGQATYSFSISSFVPLLIALEGEDNPQTHKFVVKVVDSDNKEKTETLTIQHLAQ